MSTTPPPLPTFANGCGLLPIHSDLSPGCPPSVDNFSTSTCAKSNLPTHVISSTVDIPKDCLKTPGQEEKECIVPSSITVHSASGVRCLPPASDESAVNGPCQEKDDGFQCVSVFVRPRPLHQQDETQQPTLFALDVEQGKVLVKDGSEKSYQFDGVLSSNCTQSEVYQRVVKPLVQAVLAGYNATVLAYGQTGSGKTYTMGTGGHLIHDQDKAGVLQRVLADLLPKEDFFAKALTPHRLKVSRRSTRLSSILSENSNNARASAGGARMSSKSEDSTNNNSSNADCKEYNNKNSCEAGKENLSVSAEVVSKGLGKPWKREVRLTFLEVYNEKVYDLLTPTRTLLTTKPDSAGGVQAASCSELSVVTVSEAALLLQGAVQRRSVAATALNADSSRSHALVGVKVKQCGACSVLWLVDLAGSECVGRLNQDSVGSSSRMFVEGVAINKGLLALGKVLTARAANSMHVPYRDSILTRLLRESVSGNSRTAMIACASLSVAHATDTHTTLRYAEQARNVRTKPVQQPPSTVKRLSVKRRHEDPTATPGAWKKRVHSLQPGGSAFKAPHAGPPSSTGKFLPKGGRSSNRPATRPSVVTGVIGASAVRRQCLGVVEHNTTVSTPGHTPSARQPKRPLNSTFAGHSRTLADDGSYGNTASPLLFPSLQQPLFEEEESVQPTPCSFSSLDGSTGGRPNTKRLLASSPLQGVSKLPHEHVAVQPDISALVSHLEQSVFSKMEDRLVDKLMARITRSRLRNDSASGLSPHRHCRATSPLPPAAQLMTDRPPSASPSAAMNRPCDQSSSGTPDQVCTLLDSVLATPSRRGRAKRLNAGLRRLMDMAGMNSTALLTASQNRRKSARLLPSPAPLGEATAFVPQPADQEAFLVPTMPPPSMMPKKKKNYAPKSINCHSCDLTALETKTATCPETPCSSVDDLFGVDAALMGIPLTSTTFKNNCVTRHSLRLPGQIFDRDKGRKVPFANVSLIGNVSPDLFENCEHESADPSHTLWNVHDGVTCSTSQGVAAESASDASPDLNRAAATNRKSLFVMKRDVLENHRKSRRLTLLGSGALCDITNTVKSHETDRKEDATLVAEIKMSFAGSDTLRLNDNHCNATTIMTQTSFSPCNNQTTLGFNNTKNRRGRNKESFDDLKVPILCDGSPATRVHNNTTKRGRIHEDEFKVPVLCVGSPQRKQPVDIGRRRSTRLCALNATLLNRTLLSQESPLEPRPRRRLSTSTRGRGVERATDTSRVLNSTAFAVSPSVVQQHSDQVLSLLNSGNPRQLQQLALVGPKTAMVIVMHRKFYGKFSSLTSLMDVAGLPKTFLSRFSKANMLVL